jgi:L-ascorbate metabolism protein UlaG (beta-lactamase superfamily)
VLIEAGDTRLITDPVLRRSIFGVIRRATEPPEALPEIHAVLQSHLHPDHLDYRSLRKVGSETPILAGRGSARLFRRHGFEQVNELEPGDSIRIRDAEIIATPATHDGRRLPIGPRIPALGFEIRAADRRIYFAGDTDVFDGMADLAGVDVALLPIGGWGPRVGAGHLDPRRAAEAATLLDARIVVPIHWGTYLRLDLHRRAPHLLTDPARELVSRVEELAPASEVRILAPGETLALT